MNMKEVTIGIIIMLPSYASAVSMKVAIKYMCQRHKRIQAAKTLEGEGVLLIYTSGSIALMYTCNQMSRHPDEKTAIFDFFTSLVLENCTDISNGRQSKRDDRYRGSKQIEDCSPCARPEPHHECTKLNGLSSDDTDRYNTQCA